MSATAADTEALLTRVQAAIGTQTYLEFSARWREKALLNPAALEYALDALDAALACGREGVRNRGGWLHRTFNTRHAAQPTAGNGVPE